MAVSLLGGTDLPALAAPRTRRAEELRALLALAVPLAAANLGQTLLGAVNTAVVGRLGETELGAVGLGNSAYFTVAVVGLGVMLGLDPLVAQALGSGDERRARRAVWQGLWLAVALGLPLGGLMLLVTSGLERVGIAPSSANATRDYVLARVPGLIPYLAFIATRSYLQARGTTRPVVSAVVLANLVNFPLTWLLVFGDPGLARLGLPTFGVPALGVAGAGWAATLCTVLQLGVVAFAMRRLVREHAAVARRPERALMGTALRVGIPIGLQLLAEFGVFALVSFSIGALDASSLAAHQVALTLASVTFMVPVGIGAAATVRVGHAVGRGDPGGTRAAGLLSLGVGGSFMLTTALAFATVPRGLATLITDDPAVIATAVPLLFVAAVFQLSDGLQAVAAGALRGAGDTRHALYVNLIGHYLIGLPLGMALAFWAGLGARGLWWGLSLGLTVVAVALSLRFIRLSARPVARV